MSKGKILVVEPDDDIRNMLKVYFSGQGYLVLTCENCQDALDSTRKQLPSVILTEIDLPDRSGFDLARTLRQTMRTSHLPIIFVTARNSRDDKIKGLELGVDDYVTKPFQIEELKLRIQNATVSLVTPKPINPVSGFPIGRLIEEHLKAIMRTSLDWVYFDIKIANFDTFRELRGWQAGDEVIKTMALLITNILNLHGTKDDFAGHPGGDSFVIISLSANWMLALETLKLKADAFFQNQYSEEERKQGYLLFNERQFRFMSLSVGVFVANEHPREIDILRVIEISHEDRRNRAGYVEPPKPEDGNLTEW